MGSREAIPMCHPGFPETPAKPHQICLPALERKSTPAAQQENASQLYGVNTPLLTLR